MAKAINFGRNVLGEYILSMSGEESFDGLQSVTAFVDYTINDNGIIVPIDPVAATVVNVYDAGNYYFSTGSIDSMTTCYGGEMQFVREDMGDTYIESYVATRYVVVRGASKEIATKPTKAYIGVPSGNNITPLMTANTTGDYIVSASSEIDTNRCAWNAFDNISSTNEEHNRWHSGIGLPQWIQIKFPSEVTVALFSIKNADQVHTGITTFTFFGSEDGVSWDNLGDYTNGTELGATNEFIVQKPHSYIYYRIYVTGTSYQFDGEDYAVIDEIKFYDNNTTSLARTLKKVYIGVMTDFPIYEEQDQTVAITVDNIADYFTVTNSTYYFAGSGSTFTTNNGGVASSTAQTTLTAKQDISAISFTYSYSSEASYDKFTLAVGGTTVESAVSGATTTKTYSGSLASGQTIVFIYTKDGSVNSNNDQCTFSNMSITVKGQVQTGTETKSVARLCYDATSS